MGYTSEIKNYEEAQKDLLWSPPERYNFARDVIDKWAEDPEKLAIKWVDDFGHRQDLNFAQLSSMSLIQL